MHIPLGRLNIDISREGFAVTRRDAGVLFLGSAESQGGVRVVDSQTMLPLKIDEWSSRFVLPGRTPILENIYDAIASEFSKIELVLSQETRRTRPDGTIEHTYVKVTDCQNYHVLALRPNVLQTKSEWLYTIAYQLHMYRNALVRIIRDETGENVCALEPINCEDYYFGQGYEVDGTLILKLKDKKTGNIILLDYSDVIHLRLNPNDVFYGDRNDAVDLTNFVKIFDENLSVLFNELKDAGSVQGVVEVGGAITGGAFNTVLTKNENKVEKQKEIIERIKATKGRIIVLDSGEKWTSLTRTFKTMSAEEVNNMMRYLYNFKGINQAVIDGTANESQMGVFFNKTIVPPLARLIEELNYKFLTQAARARGQMIEYFKNPFEYTATKDLLSNLYLGAMFFTQNEVRRMAFKTPPLPGGDELMNNKNFIKEIKGTQNGGSDEE